MHHNGVHHDLVVLVARIVHDEEPVDEAPDAAATTGEELADSQTGIPDVEKRSIPKPPVKIERMRAVVGSLSCEVYINKESSSSVMRLRRSASCAAVKNFALVARNILILF